MAYRIQVAGLHAGLQGQFRGASSDQLIDSVGASLWYALAFGLSLGASYNKHFLTDVTSIAVINDYNGEADAIHGIAGARYEGQGIYAAATVSYARNHEVIALPGDGPLPELTMLDTLGIEVFGSYTFLADSLTLELGYNLLEPLADPAFAPGYRRSLLTVGGAYHFARGVTSYLEGGFQVGSEDARGQRPDHAVTLGLRVDFSATEIMDRRE